MPPVNPRPQRTLTKPKPSNADRRSIDLSKVDDTAGWITGIDDHDPCRYRKHAGRAFSLCGNSTYRREGAVRDIPEDSSFFWRRSCRQRPLLHQNDLSECFVSNRQPRWVEDRILHARAEQCNGNFDKAAVAIMGPDAVVGNFNG